MSSNIRVLNLTASGGSSSARRPPSALALELQKSMLQLKGQYMSEDGHEVHYDQLRDSQLFAEYKQIAKLLCNCELGNLQEEDERKAFFISIPQTIVLKLFSLFLTLTLIAIDIYNALTVHGLIMATPLPSSVLELDQFWAHTAYDIGGHIFSLDDIEHGVLRGNRPHPSAELPPFSEDDPRKTFALKSCDARIHFALVCGAKSCPAIQVYSSSNIDRALTLAAQSFCSQEMEVDKVTRTVTTSKILHWYARDFGSREREILQWLCAYLPEQAQRQLKEMLATQDPITISAREYNWQLNSMRSAL